MRDDADAALVAMARAGDRGAFALLLVRHRPLLVALCRRVLGRGEGVEDVVQEAALQAWVNLDRLRRPERFGPWLAGIGLNLARRVRRAGGGGGSDWSWEAVIGGRSGPEPVDLGPGPEEQAEAAELAERVRAAVAALPPGQRAAVLLVSLEGLTQAEAAAQLGVEVGAVKARLFKARGRLRRTLRATWEAAGMATVAGTEAVEARVVDVRRAPSPDGEPGHLVIVLEEIGGGRRLPIWVGEFEGTAVALHLEQVDLPRPMTYAFAAGLIAAAGGRLREVRIDRLEGEVFYAVAVVEGAGGATEVDARPSDALNLAVLVGAPVRVAAAVFEQVDRSPQREELRSAALEGAGIEGAARIAAAAQSAWRSRAAATGEATGEAAAGESGAATAKGAAASAT